VFRRRRNEQNDRDQQVETTDVDVEQEAAEAAPAEPVGIDRSAGPYDVTEVTDDGLTRLDLGGLRVPGADGMQLRVELDETGENVVAVTVIDGESSMQLMAFAAPRTDGIWDGVREEIRANLAAGGPVDVVDTELGRELRANVPVAGPQGQSMMQPVRFVGIDGPRWFLRALFTGAASRDAAAAAGLESVLRSVVVLRGSDPMAPGDPLELRVPEVVPEGMSRGGSVEDAQDAQDGRPPLTMPERGPEITEIR
jgi:hypothetical protein